MAEQYGISGGISYCGLPMEYYCMFSIYLNKKILLSVVSVLSTMKDAFPSLYTAHGFIIKSYPRPGIVLNLYYTFIVTSNKKTYAEKLR